MRLISAMAFLPMPHAKLRLYRARQKNERFLTEGSEREYEIACLKKNASD